MGDTLHYCGEENKFFTTLLRFSSVVHCCSLFLFNAGGFVEYGHGYMPVIQQNCNVFRSEPQPIPEIDIPEAYLSQQEQYEALQRRGDPSRSSKGSRRILPFLQKKKKSQSEVDFDSRTDDIGLSYYEEGDADDITTYEEAMEESLRRQEVRQNSLNPEVLEQLSGMQLGDSQYGAEAQVYERLNYIINNYRHPPPYPGHTSINSGPSMIKQLLQEQEGLQIKDNASMINYCQVDAPSGLSMEDLTKIMRAFPEDSTDYRQLPRKPQPPLVPYRDYLDTQSVRGASQLPDTASDGLVMMTKGGAHLLPNQKASHFDETVSASELFERRKKYYSETYRDTSNAGYRGRHIAELISEIYPRDYDVDYEQDGSVKNVDDSVSSFSLGSSHRDSLSEYTFYSFVALITSSCIGQHNKFSVT